ncbi:SNF2 family N-terminal domain-containing protein [Aspergillus avenaceus]|uniref:SNF2 family N-terminal domain-containing protein n=1 Tax=Aspergillus avenaceus TaxID=36643 RepID=A0A5N6TNI9_ASPAV|nr:SNF2 family N-terminal domain-containing protein [Aspergillus avenaceus]
MESDNESETLDIDAKMAETIDTRREQLGARNAIARSQLSMNINSAANPPCSEPLFVSMDSSFLNSTAEGVLDMLIPSPIPPSMQDTSFMSTPIPLDPELDTFFSSNTDNPNFSMTTTESLLSPNIDSFVEALRNAGHDRPRGNLLLENDALSHINEGPSNTATGRLPLETGPTENGGPEWSENGSDSESEHDDSIEFDDIENWFNGLSDPTLEETVRYQAAKLKEDTRKTRAANRKALKMGKQEIARIENEPIDLASLVPSSPQEAMADQTITASPPQAAIPRTVTKRKRQNRISADERRRSMQYGLDVTLGRVRQRKRSHGVRRPAVEKSRSGLSKTFNKKKIGGAKILEELLGSNTIEEAQASAPLPAVPKFTEKDKNKALIQMIASIPTSDQKQAGSDKQRILEATKRFNRSARSDGQGGWRIKGLKTSLYNYQLQGAAFMRDRENSSQPPFGGLLCDTMGFGKTIQTLANIVDGKPTDPDDPAKTTLIVVPSHLITHWMRQMAMHCEEDAIGEVLVYSANSRLVTLDVPKSIQKHNIVITTYDEVRKSYPRCNMPNQIADEQKLTEWWNQTFQDEAGPLHKIKFRRIILDEAHTIKNHLSQCSMAIRALTGHYKWALSGTPIQNRIQEFYPLFDFLAVPRTGNYDTFTKLYCRDEGAKKRLTNLLRTFMYRRTHASRLFSLPVIKLPGIKEKTISSDFCEAERAIYNAIIDAFFEVINGLANKKNSRYKQYRCFLTMILKLRMFSSHILTAQDIVKKLLSGELIRELIKLSNSEKDTRGPSYTIVQWLRAMKREPVLPVYAMDSTGACVEEPSEELGGDSDHLTKEFKRFMESLHEKEEWPERLERSNCADCKLIPQKPIITSCMHLYCEECYYTLTEEGSTPTTMKRICSKCDVPIDLAALCADEVDETPKISHTPITREPPLKRRKTAKRKFMSSMWGVTTNSGDGDDEDQPDDDEEIDWVAVGGGYMPSAKMTKIQETIQEWMKENKDVKVVIFTQFLNFVRLLSIMCHKQKWGATCFTGTMSSGAREQSIDKFREEPGIQILIASLKAGGFGIDMSMANKCILVDLWWNEAVQEQAFCRLFRIGQTRNVEFVKIVIRNSIDESLSRIQSLKTESITSTMGDEVLESRDSVIELLRMFGTVDDDASGIVHVERNPRPQF